MTTLSKAMLRELRTIEETGRITDPDDWYGAGSLWFHAREKVITALLRRGLIAANHDYELTDAGRAVLHG